jgi:programmed cell death protein 5
MLTQLCTPQARERLNRIAIVKPDKVRQIEDNLLQAAMRGQIRSKITEDAVISMLEQTTAPASTSVKILRRKPNFDSDEEDLDML